MVTFIICTKFIYMTNFFMPKFNDVIIIIDEFHTLLGAGTTRDGGADAADILKPALARGELTCIGITTQDEYARFVEQDQALARRFERIIVDEPDETATRDILNNVVVRFRKHHAVTVRPEALDAIVQLASQYLPSRQFPDKAIDILGRACSRAENIARRKRRHRRFNSK